MSQQLRKLPSSSGQQRMLPVNPIAAQLGCAMHDLLSVGADVGAAVGSAEGAAVLSQQEKYVVPSIAGQHLPAAMPMSTQRTWFWQSAAVVGDVEGAVVGAREGHDEGDDEGKPEGACVGVAVSHFPSLPQFPLAQSLPYKHRNPTPHRAGHVAPPQSTDVSSPFSIPSPHAADEGESDGCVEGEVEGANEGDEEGQ